MSMQSSLAIEINNLRFDWSAPNDQPLISIDHWQLAGAEKVFLRGDSGSGKSTLLSLLTGIMSPQQGTITLLGTDIQQLNNRQRDRFRAQHLGVIFQQFNLLPYLSIEENILLGATFSKTQKSAERTQELCEQLKLNTEVLQQAAEKLSVGQQQRVAIARALYHKPKIIIADEPTSALDNNTRNEFIELLLQQAQLSNSAVILVSHDTCLAKHFDRSEDIGDLHAA